MANFDEARLDVWRSPDRALPVRSCAAVNIAKLCIIDEAETSALGVRAPGCAALPPSECERR